MPSPDEQRLVVMGECSYTARIVRKLLQLNVVPAAVIVRGGVQYFDPFENLRIVGPSPYWYRDHRYTFQEWRPDLAAVCAASKIPFQERIDVFAEEIPGDVLLVAGFSPLVPKPVLEEFGAAALNAHPSLLPRFAGPQPEAQVILHGLKKNGVSIHTMTSRFDDGPVRYQAPYRVPHDSTVGSMELRGAVGVAHGMAALLRQPVKDWSVVPTQGERHYLSFFDENVLDLSQSQNLAQVRLAMRLRPEGYAYLDVDGKRIYPMRLAEPEQGQAFPWRQDVLWLAEWVEVEDSQAYYSVTTTRSNDSSSRKAPPGGGR